MGKSTIYMAIFHCYVSSPEGIYVSDIGILVYHNHMIDNHMLKHDMAYSMVGYVGSQRWCGGVETTNHIGIGYAMG